MDPIRSVLLALDLDPRGRRLTPGSRLAADQALTLAKSAGARVLVFHSKSRDEAWDPVECDYVLAQEGVPAAGHAALESVRDELLAASVPAELEISEDAAWLGIVQRVLRDGIDLVVSGKRSEDEDGGHRIGSVAMKLLRKCPCPVWVVKPGGHQAPRRVLAATDLSPVGDRVLELAAWVAGTFGAELHVVHSFQLPFDVQWEGEGAAASWERNAREEARKRLETRSAELGFTGELHIYLGLTSPSRAILACEERLEPDLVVMGTVSRGGVAGLLVGNTAERLLARLDSSLLTVKPEDFVCPVKPD